MLRKLCVLAVLSVVIWAPLMGEDYFGIVMMPGFTVGYGGMALDLLAAGLFNSQNQPLMLVKVGYIRAGVIITQPCITGEPSDWTLLGGTVVLSGCAGLDVYQPGSPYPILPFFEFGACFVKGSFMFMAGIAWPFDFYVDLCWVFRL